jgi:hypothetical protein
VDIKKLNLPHDGVGSLGSISAQASAISTLADLGAQIAKFGDVGSVAALAGPFSQADLAKSGILNAFDPARYDDIAAGMSKMTTAGAATLALTDMITSRQADMQDAFAQSSAAAMAAQVSLIVGPFDAYKRGVIEACTVKEIPAFVSVAAMAKPWGDVSSLGASIAEMATKSMGSIALSVSQAFADSQAEQVKSLSANLTQIQDAVARNRPKLPDVDSGWASRYGAAEPWPEAITSHSYALPPLPAFVERDDERMSALEDRVEALEDMLRSLLEVTAELREVSAERDAFAARCADQDRQLLELERQNLDLRTRRRFEVLDASQEHKPEPPVDESQFPDPR